MTWLSSVILSIVGFTLFLAVYVCYVWYQDNSDPLYRVSLAASWGRDKIWIRHHILRQQFDRAVGADMLAHLSRACEAAQVEWWVACGTALGAVREQNFLLHDTDVDVGGWATDKERWRHGVFPHLLKMGFVFTRGHPEARFHTFSYRGEYLDIELHAPGHHCVDHGKLCDDIIPLVRAERRQDVTLGGVTYSAPPDEYLVLLYGNDWQTPCPGFHAPS